MQYEYAVIPAPTRTKRQKGINTAGERLAVAMEDAINIMASEGWEYLRTDTLTVEDKAGRFSRIVEKIETVLVFRREASARAQVTMPIAREIPAPISEVEPKRQMRAKSVTDEGNGPSLGGVTRD